MAIPLDSANRGRIDINHGAGLLHVGADAPDNLLAQGKLGGGLDPQITHTGDLVEARLQVTKKLGFMNFRYPWAWGPASTLDWNMNVNPHIPLELDIKTGADQIDLFLTDTHLATLNLETSGSSTDLQLPAHAGKTSVHIKAVGASLTVLVPTDVAAAIHTNKATSNIEVDPKRFSLLENGTKYVSSNYETAANRVEIQVDLNLSFIKFV